MPREREPCLSLRWLEFGEGKRTHSRVLARRWIELVTKNRTISDLFHTMRPLVRYHVSRQELFNLVWSEPMRDVAARFKFSDVALSKPACVSNPSGHRPRKRTIACASFLPDHGSHPQWG